MSSVDPTRTITPEMRRELLAAWDEAQNIVNRPEFWNVSAAAAWFTLTFKAFGTCLHGPLNVAAGA